MGARKNARKDIAWRIRVSVRGRGRSRRSRKKKKKKRSNQVRAEEEEEQGEGSSKGTHKLRSTWIGKFVDVITDAHA